MSVTGEQAKPPTLDWALGSLDARVTLLERGMRDMQREINDKLNAIDQKNDMQNKKIDALTEAMVASRSSWKAILWFIGLLTTASTVITGLHQLGVIH